MKATQIIEKSKNFQDTSIIDDMKEYVNVIDSKYFKPGDDEINVYSHCATTVRERKPLDDINAVEIELAVIESIENLKYGFFITYKHEIIDNIPFRDCGNISVSIAHVPTQEVFVTNRAKLYVHDKNTVSLSIEIPEKYREEPLFYIQKFHIKIITNKMNYFVGFITDFIGEI